MFISMERSPAAPSVFSDGSMKTLGIMLPGEYEFNTAEKEIMEILAGDLEVLCPERTSG